MAIVPAPDGLDTSMPSTMNLLSPVAPRTIGTDALKASDPPTSILFITTLGSTLVTDQMSVRLGRASSSALVIVVCLPAFVVSSSGTWVVTVMASSMAPTLSRRSARAVASALTTMLPCVTVWKPGSWPRTL